MKKIILIIIVGLCMGYGIWYNNTEHWKTYEFKGYKVIFLRYQGELSGVVVKGDKVIARLEEK